MMQHIRTQQLWGAKDRHCASTGRTNRIPRHR